ncbi:MAG TPA: AtpZ/AtpI family protein [Methyloceanibacter sp.]|nr:AtpZ/AtpI family protein [Methyloceanibacter sp.]
MAGADEKSGRNDGDRDTHSIRQRLDVLGRELETVRARRVPPSANQRARGVAMGQAVRLGTELVAGVAVGGFIGWALDQGFGTAPFLMVVFLLLGGAAGIIGVMRTAKRMQETAGPLPGKDLPNEDDD